MHPMLAPAEAARNHAHPRGVIGLPSARLWGKSGSCVWTPIRRPERPPGAVSIKGPVVELVGAEGRSALCARCRGTGRSCPRIAPRAGRRGPVAGALGGLPDLVAVVRPF